MVRCLRYETLYRRCSERAGDNSRVETLVIRFTALVAEGHGADRLAYNQSAHTFEPETSSSKATIGTKRFLLDVRDAEAKTLK